MAKTLADYDGIIFTSNEGYDFIIIEYINNKQLQVEFLDTGFRKWSRISDVNAGKLRDQIAYNEMKQCKDIKKQEHMNIKQQLHEEERLSTLPREWSKMNPYKITVQGKGFYGNPDKSLSHYNKARDLWTGILRRCYSGDGKDDNYFLHVEVCKRWHCLEMFIDDLPNIIGFDKWVSGSDMQLDKDLLSDQKIYSPETCIFLDAKINNQLQSKDKLKIARERISKGSMSHIPASKLPVMHRTQTWQEFIKNEK